MLSPDTFSRLLELARAGDESALAELARAYEPDIRLVARLRLGAALRPHLDSMDLVQSAHHSLFRGLREGRFRLDSPEQLVALAAAVVRRKAARHWRRFRRQQRLSGTGGDGAADLLAAVANPDPDPARQAEFRDGLEHAFRQLDEVGRRAVELRLRGCSRAEVARELGLDDLALLACLTRVRRRLRAAGALAEWL